MNRILAVLVAAAGVAAPTAAQVQVLELGWVLEREIASTDPISALMNPVDGLIYAGQRGQDVYVIDADGVRTKVVDTDDVAGLCVVPQTGDLFMSEDYPGNIRKIAFGATTAQTWVTGFDSGDDDPIGIACVPETYAGTLLTPGGMVSTDRGYGSDDEVWAWSPVTPEGEIEIYNAGSEMVDPVDIAVRADGEIAIADMANGIKLLHDNGTLTDLATSVALGTIQGLAFDGRSDDLFALDTDSGLVLRIDIATGQATPIIAGLPTGGTNWGGLNVYAGSDTQRIIVSSVSADRIYVFAAVPGCNIADLSVPFGLLDLSDVTLFVSAFTGLNPIADLNDDGLYDLTDVLGYVDAFLAGCP
ncbi:MAG: hypothetical protein H6810_04725 [Phycisphaeraceae bacterium]|nr:MAG: hypothetical protein H6810_04725 [Phycisphaeraceae bacterium]